MVKSLAEIFTELCRLKCEASGEFAQELNDAAFHIRDLIGLATLSVIQEIGKVESVEAKEDTEEDQGGFL